MVEREGEGFPGLAGGKDQERSDGRVDCIVSGGRGNARARGGKGEPAFSLEFSCGYYEWALR